MIDSVTSLPLKCNAKFFGHFEKVHLVFGKILSNFWQFFYSSGQIFICQILND